MADPTPITPIQDPSSPKEWYASKTIWLNVVLTLVGVATFFAEPRNDPVASVASIAAAVVGVCTVVLRVWFTSAAIVGTRRALRVLAAQAERAGRAVSQTTS
jgi:hypothetical protein